MNARDAARTVETDALAQAQADAQAWQDNYDGMFWRWAECDAERLALKEALRAALLRLRIQDADEREPSERDTPVMPRARQGEVPAAPLVGQDTRVTPPGMGGAA